MTYHVEVENIRCGGCANTIRKKLLAVAGVSEVTVNIDGQTVAVVGSVSSRDLVVEALTGMGYPPRGAGGLGNKARALVSCAVGRITPAVGS